MNIEYLNKIKKVEAPPFLLTRIRQRIENEKSEKVPVSLAWAFRLSFVLILAVNVFAFSKSDTKSNGVQEIASSMQLMNENSIYK